MKCLKHQDSSINPEHHPGCMWGILHNLNHNRWHQVRRRLPHKRLRHRKQVADIGDKATVTDSDDTQGRVEGKTENSPILAKTIKPAPVSKSSMLSRIRSLLIDETSKRKGRHHRSSSCPIHLHQPNSIHHLDPAHLQSSLEIPLKDKTLKRPCMDNSSVSSVVNHLPKMKHAQSVYSRDQAKNASTPEPINLENASSFSFMKSDSFPSRGSRGRRSERSRILKNRMECEYYAKGEQELGSAGFDSAEQVNSHSDLSSDDDFGKHLITRLESFDNVCPSSPRAKKKHHESKLFLNRFKNLREKIRHALRESRRERRRIIMDAVFHKVPYGRGSSKDIKNGTTYGHCSSPFSKSESKFFRRTLSVNESLDRYNRLLDSCFYKDEKQQTSDGSRASGSPSPARSSSPIGFERILSLPDLRYYPSFKLEDSPETGFSNALSRAGSSNNLSVGITKSNEQKSVDIPLGSVNQTEPDYNSMFLDVNESFDDFSGLKTDGRSSSVENIIEATSSLNSKLDTSVPIQNSISSSAKGAEADAVNLEMKGFSACDLKKTHSPIQVDERYKAEFNYVKGVLELSGFSGNESLGKWHSAEQAVNPSVFEELEEGNTRDQLLMFDLINEVLLQVHERSCSYWPKSLTCRSYINTMPVGYHVLEEVWTDINSCLGFNLKNDESVDDAVSRDLAKDDTWMNLQFDAVCVGLELEDVILDDLLEELISDPCTDIAVT